MHMLYPYFHNHSKAQMTMELPFPQLDSGIIAGIIAILLFAYYRGLKESRAKNVKTQAPKAGAAWLVLGHLPLLAGSQLPHLTLGDLADTYGPIFTLQLGFRQALVVSAWEMAKELYTKNDAVVSSRPKLTAMKLLSYDFSMLSFAPYGAYWREIRKIVIVELLSNRRLELLKHVRISEVETSIKELHKLCTEKNSSSSSSHVSVDLKQWFEDLSLNVILRMVAGKRYFGAGDAGNKEEIHRCQNAIREFFRLLGLFVVRDAIPFLGWLDVGGHERAMKRTAKDLDEILSQWLEEHRRKRDSGEVTENGQDFMDVMLSVLEGTNFAGFDSDTINKSTCLIMIAGGSDTVAGTMTSALSLLLNNRQDLKKVQEELDIHVGSERVVDESDISKLVYLQAIVKETLRLYPPAPLSGPRETTEDCNINGYHVKAGTRVITNLWKIHRDARIWQEPLEFRPERFLTRHKDVDVRGQDFELIPFGSGRRSCPGTSFALQMVHLALASFLHGFDFSTPSNAPVDMTEKFGLTNVKATPLDVIVSPRLPSKLYA